MTAYGDRPAGTRQRLVTAATGLFRRYGVARTGIGDICERAGVTKGVFSHHFPGGKTELVLEVVGRNAGEVERALVDLAPEKDGPVGELVERLFGSYAELLRVKGTDFGCPVAASVVDASMGSPRVRAAARSAFDAWRDALRRLDPEVGPPADLDTLIVAALEGAILLARAEDDPVALERVGGALGGLLRSCGEEARRRG